jgi:hypothetical protein
MADREASFAELIEVLRQAQEAVHRELALRQTQEFDREALLRLLAYVRSFADQALSLFRLMANSDPDDVPMEDVAKAHDLVTSFRATEDRIKAVLELGRWGA